MRAWWKSRGPPGRTELEDSILVGCVEGRGQGRRTQEALFIEGTIEKVILFRPFAFGFVWFMGVWEQEWEWCGCKLCRGDEMMTVVMVVSYGGSCAGRRLLQQP
jgi:hypothetical protein